MNRKLQRSLSLAMLTLTLASAGAPTISTLAATTKDPGTDQTTKVPVTSGQPTTTAPTTPVKPAKPVKKPGPIYDKTLPESLSDLGETVTDKYGDLVLKAPVAGQPGALLGLTGTSNTRELGGYVTADGKWKIKSGRLLRSDNLHRLKDADKQLLLKAGLKQIVDMRTPGQVLSGKDIVPDGVKWENISILGQFADGGYNTDSDGNYTADGSSKSHDGGFYNHQLEFSGSAINGYHRFLEELLTNKGATLFHCSSGKDRTGIGTVLIMSILGMSPTTIARDYMLSDSYGHPVDYSWLKEYYREINNYYHGMPKYLVQALNFSPYEQELLKSKYLVSTDGKDTPYPAPASPVVTTPNYVAPAPVKPVGKPTADQKPVTKPVDQVKPEASVKPDKTVTKHKVTKKARTKVKVVSVKKIKKAKFVSLKGHRAYFYDMKLKHKVGKSGKTGLHPKARWKLMKTAKIKLNGKTKTFYQVKSPHGALRWIQSNFVKSVKA